MIYPANAITKTLELINVSSSTIETIPTTVYGVSIQQSGSQSDTNILCGNDQILHNYGTRDLSQQLIQYKCANNLIANKTGTGDKAFIQITYTTSTEVLATSTIISPLSFSGGEVVISVLLLFSFLFSVFYFLVARFLGLAFNRKK